MTLRTDIAVRLRAYVLTLKPADALPTERELVAAYGTSRGTVRRALAVLEREGLIVRYPYKGAFKR